MARALRSVDPSMPTLLITGEDLSEGAVVFVFSATHGRGFNKNYVREEIAGAISSSAWSLIAALLIRDCSDPKESSLQLLVWTIAARQRRFLLSDP